MRVSGFRPVSFPALLFLLPFPVQRVIDGLHRAAKLFCDLFGIPAGLPEGEELFGVDQALPLPRLLNLRFFLPLFYPPSGSSGTFGNQDRISSAQAEQKSNLRICVSRPCNG